MSWKIAARLTIEVTAEDIRRGTRGITDECPIVLALRRRCLELDQAYNIPFDLLPLSALAFVEAFDSGLSVAPFSFEVDVVDSPCEGSVWNRKLP